MPRISLFALAIACSTAAAGNTVLFFDPTVFHTAVPGATLIDNFEDSNPALRDILLPSYSGPGNEITFTPFDGSPVPNVFLASPGYNNFGAGLNPTTSVILTGNGNEGFTGSLTSTMFALGFDLFLNDSPLTITFYSGANPRASWTFDNPTDAGNNLQFLGISSTDGITSFTLTAINGGQINTGVDNIYAQLFDGPVGVPEPSTWAMMLFGFGAIGLAMRRSRRTGVLVKQLA